MLLFRGGGLLSWMVGIAVTYLLVYFPLTADPSAWYFGSSALVLCVPLGLGLYGFWTALAGRPLLGGELPGR